MLNQIQSPMEEVLIAAPYESSGILPLATGDILAALTILVLAGLMWLEKKRPFARAALTAVKRSYCFNLATFLLNNLALSLISLPTLYFIAETYSGFGLLGDLESGPVKFLVSFLLLDLTMYGWHFAMHHDDGLWHFHRVHHDDECLNVTTGLRFHAGELMLEIIVRAFFIMVIGVESNVVLTCQGVIGLFVLMHHGNLKLPGERLLGYLFIVPRLHRVHHSVLREEHDSNYGAVFSIWDRLFGTLRDQEPTAIGLPPSGAKGFTEALRETVMALIQPAAALQPVAVRATRQPGREPRRTGLARH